MAEEKQHYVWQHYLRAWSNKKGRVWFKRNGYEPGMVNPKKIMAERGFYELQQLNEHEVNLIRSFIDHGGYSDLREIHRETLEFFVFIPKGNEIVQHSRRASIEQKKNAQSLVVNAEDMIHGKIERNALPILDELRNRQSTFIHSDESAADFFLYLAHQHNRTKKIREAFRTYFSQISTQCDFAKVANFMCYYFAINLANGLYLRRKDFDVIFLDCDGDARFVTSDQPIINLMGNRHGGDTTKTVLYYPLSPDLSCLILPKAYNLHSTQVTNEIAEKLNGFIALNSNQFLVGDSKNSVQLAFEMQRATNLSSGVVLRNLVSHS